MKKRVGKFEQHFSSVRDFTHHALVVRGDIAKFHAAAIFSEYNGDPVGVEDIYADFVRFGFSPHNDEQQGRPCWHTCPSNARGAKKVWAFDYENDDWISIREVVNTRLLVQALEAENERLKARVAELEAQAKDSSCEWNEHLDGFWITACGQTFEFFDGGPEDNHMKNCPFCSGRIEPKKYSESMGGEDGHNRD